MKTYSSDDFVPSEIPLFSEPMQVENNTCSRLHTLIEALLLKQITDLDSPGFDTYAIHVDDVSETMPTFVVKQDWYSVLEGVTPLDDEIKLPHQSCSFEFMINETPLICWVWEEDEHFNFCLFVFYENRWWKRAIANPHDHPESLFIWNQIKALLVALDAEVACIEVIRAPSKLNKKRSKKGKPLLNDYHIVNLAKRHQIANPHSGHSGAKYRLHFRRGHWRHYEDHKTWIKWCLAGDPDLGFVNKHYTM